MNALLASLAIASSHWLAQATIAQAATEKAEPERGFVAFVLAMLLIGVAAVGVILLIVVVLWGGRTRRISREPLPHVREPETFDTMRADARRPRSSAGATVLPDNQTRRSADDDIFGDGDDIDFDGGDELSDD